MKILVVGSGGREHALIRKIKESRHTEAVYACPGNGGIAADALCIDLKATDIAGISSFALEHKIDLVVVAPDDPLVLGMVDALNAKGIKTFGPTKAAALIEGSKVFSKALMKKYGIPTAAYASFSAVEEAAAYINALPEPRVVIKADGLALGKGVIIAQTHQEAIDAVKSMIEDKAFGESGSEVVVEEYLEGVEVSVLCFTDGKAIVPMVSSMDHKRALEGDQGLNTGGMGTIAPHPLYTPELSRQAMEQIFIPTIEAMKAEGRTFKGCLYFGLMLTAKGPYVIEYNCRFGDPETQVVLPLLKTDLVDIMLAIDSETLGEMTVEWSSDACACVIMASGGYPGTYCKGCVIEGLDHKGQLKGATIYHAGTAVGSAGFVTSGGRVLGISATGKTLTKALEQCYAVAEQVSFEGCYYRRDIGAKVCKDL